MKYKIEKYLLKKTDELAFITLKSDGEFKIKGYDIPSEGLDVPIKNEVLVKGIKDKTAQESLNSMSIADAMIYIIGIDSNFKYNDNSRGFADGMATSPFLFSGIATGDFLCGGDSLVRHCRIIN